jgi:hypothetical protein
MLKPKPKVHLHPPTGCPRDSAARGQAPVLLLAALACLAAGCVLFAYYISVAPAQFPLLALAGFVVFVVAFFRMDAALVLLIMAMLFSPEISAGHVPRRNIAIRIEDILIVVLGMAWIARGAVHKGFEIVPKTAVNGKVALYCGCFFISTASGIVMAGVNPVKASFYVLKYLEYFILFYLAAGTIRHKKNLYVYLAALLITFACVNLYATSQVGVMGRVSAPFQGESGEPNTLGGYQVLMLCVTLGLFCHARTRQMSWLLGALALSTLWPFLNTLSRASYVALIPAYIMLIVYNRSPRRNILVILLLLGVVFAALFMPQKVRDRIAYTFKPQYQENIQTVDIMGVQLDPSSSARWNDWSNAVQYWKKAPFFGLGVTGTSFLDGQYINNLVELGVVGFCAFAILIWGVHTEVLRVYRGTDDWVVKGLSLGFAAGNIGILVHAITANTFIIIRIMEPYWFMAAMILVYPRLAGGSLVTEPKKAGHRNIDLVLGSGQSVRGADGT